MCKCTPGVKTPYCGRSGCERPERENFFTRVNVDDVWVCHDKARSAVVVEVDAQKLRMSWQKFEILRGLVLDVAPPALSKPEAAPAGEVVVKPLEWPDQCKLGRRVHSNPLIGGIEQYCITHYGAEVGAPIYRWARQGSAWSDAHDTYDDAKAAAQADYEQRIRSALIATPPAITERERMLREALHRLVNAKALSRVRAIVAGWNGEGRDEPYNERHPARLGATLPTNCGAVYELDEAMQSARAALDGGDHD